MHVCRVNWTRLQFLGESWETVLSQSPAVGVWDLAGIAWGADHEVSGLPPLALDDSSEEVAQTLNKQAVSSLPTVDPFTSPAVCRRSHR